jgi:thioesterase domain-containing protein
VAPGFNALGHVAMTRPLPADQPVYIVQPRTRARSFASEGIGPDGRDEYPLVAAEYVASIRAAQPNGPYYLSGMCDGALIAFEMARQLEAAGERVAELLILDTYPLENTSYHPLVVADLLLRTYRTWQPGEARERLRKKATEVVARGVARLPLIPRARPAATDAGAGREAERKARWRAKLWPGTSFIPPVINAPIAVLRVDKQPYWRVRDDALCWRSRTTGVVTVHILPGDHVTLTRAPHVESWARVVTAYLDGALFTPPARVRKKRPDPA